MMVVLALAAVALVVVGVLLVRGNASPPPRPDLARALARPAAEPLASPAAGSTETAAAADADESEAGLPRDPSFDEPESEVPADQPPAAPAITGPVVPPAGEHPRVAIVIDDLGRSVATLERLAAIGIPFTYAVLPFEQRTMQVVAWLRENGGEVLCHLPMEPSGGQDPGPGALYRSMSPDELAAATRHALDQVPIAIGANNHMGSGFSAEEGAMRAVLGVLAERGLFYLDSRTTPDTVGLRVASGLGLRAAERQVFLDNVRDEGHIRAQLDVLLNEAVRRGSAVAIAHPYPETLRVLASEAVAARDRGFVFVTASALTKSAEAIARAGGGVGE